ncbi:MAG: ABC transporter permease [Bacteroides sp.]|nr:ABC transporter permease [Ruminococcus flavefaciens]MCM1555694.1 ABC transporter permease [Bacteroides sp.]
MKNNTWVVLEREYMTRVKKKSFLIATILVPVLMVALIFSAALISTIGGSKTTFAVVDETGLYAGSFVSEGDDTFEYAADTAAAFAGMREGSYDAMIWLPAGSQDSNRQRIQLFYEKTEPSVAKLSKIENMAETRLRMELLQKESGIDEATFSYINGARVDIVSQDRKTGERSYTEVKTGLAYVLGFLIYMFIFMFGNMIMAGVIEEKSSRIIEVMISSVKPMQLLMGKVFGLVLVCLTQFLVWIVLTLLLTFVVGLFAGGMSVDAAQLAATQGMPADMLPVSEFQEMMQQFQSIVASLHLKQLFIFFLIYFLGGYLLYASLFAAVGSAVEKEEEASQFMLPITIPLIIAIIITTSVLQDPSGPLAFWGSMIPFTSPIVMLARIPFGVPAWELALSIGLLVVGFVASIWVASRIYRVGILMYGKKSSYKELWKWIRYKN